MANPTNFIITMDDCQKAGHCPTGVRRWFNEQGIPFRDFMRDGVPAKVMLSTGDANGRQVVGRAVKRRIEGAANLTENEAIDLLEAGNG